MASENEIEWDVIKSQVYNNLCSGAKTPINLKIRQ